MALKVGKLKFLRWREFVWYSGNLISDDCGLGGEISVFAQEAQRSLAEIIPGLEARVRGGENDARAFKERACALLARNQESYNQKMAKYVDFQRKTQKVSIL